MGSRRCRRTCKKSTCPPDLSTHIQLKSSKSKREILSMQAKSAISTHYKPQRRHRIFVREPTKREDKHFCLINDSPKGRYFYREHILGHTISVQQEQFLTLAELGQAGCLQPRNKSHPREEKRKVIHETIAKHTHLTAEQRNQLRAALYRQHEAEAESKLIREERTQYPMFSARRRRNLRMLSNSPYPQLI